MYITGKKEVDALAKVILSGKPLFRYRKGECVRFERRYAQYLNTEHVCMTSSGTTALSAALVGLGVGPGDEVIVPACTYMSSAVAVLAAGAIPVVCDVDESLTISPKALEAKIGPRTRAVIPVHMWGLACDLNAIMRIARKHKVLVLEDACQSVGGGYKGKKLGAIGHAGGFSFNHFKNMTCGEGGAFVTNDERVFLRAKCHVDCCSYYWNGVDEGVEHFISNGARASEFEGALMNAQLDRIDGMLNRMRKQKKRILMETADVGGLRPIKANSLDDECGTHVGYLLPTAELAQEFSRETGGFIAANTGRHVYTNWDPILDHMGGPHPALNPFKFKENKGCRMTYTEDMCAGSLDILRRACLFPTHASLKRSDITKKISKVRRAAKKLGLA